MSTEIKVQHLQEKWIIRKGTFKGNDVYEISRPSDNHWIALILADKEGLRDGKRIIKAVNNYRKMYETLKAIAEATPTATESKTAWIRNAQQIALKAIKAAE